ncbi:hypothetical protein KAFR_0C01050 [Kazachstania africana CBS 2517]|uniref:Matrin-type domain-containing protein n=1 Tax=Kazachstania africana (strain ATCC 22294 / BCRC 22015 / CBS 2517 / CECT 1963 / NBRC 1671 / NRRL Y-8276) TaxID=1071382 RepID=H2ARV0_KAZAF|nr:hypothetical protein KAFR_0C01050 [Kazachstania africana CBS 2517]CCF57100.1 hypothetical protein KAFR_0C01050 [Kazachstania africana CBS 2517]
MANLEEKRDLCEDLEVIEDAIAKRLQRNPELYYNYLEKLSSFEKHSLEVPSSIDIKNNRVYKSKKAKRSKKQIVAQQHEIRLFIEDYTNKQKGLNMLMKRKDTTQISSDIGDFITSITENKSHVKSSLKDKIDYYSMFSASTTQKSILSKRAADLDINQTFTRDEQFGECMDLERFHNVWLSVVKDDSYSLLDFFRVIESFLDTKSYLKSPHMDRKNQRYQEFIKTISGYVESFFFKKFCLIDKEYVNARLQQDFILYLDNPLNNQNGFFCVACNKSFKTKSVFDNHLPGKQHKRNVDKRRNSLISEYKLYRFLNLLRTEFNNTKEFTERKISFTANERREELERLNNEYNAPVYGSEEQEEGDEEHDEYASKNGNRSILDGLFNMPLGPDGVPMPFWLYKLQGLDVSYYCEICSNREFKGRRAFERHFNEKTHQYHLRCLGITPSPTFVGITAITEAQTLWDHIQSTQKKKAPSGKIDMDIEVEDADGNVLTRKVYDDLKRQGLL